MRAAFIEYRQVGTALDSRVRGNDGKERFFPLRGFVVLFVLFFAIALEAAPAPDLEEQTRIIANELRCVVCQNLSVADSPSEMAQQMRAIVREQLQAGKTPEEVKAYFVSKYGEWVLLAPIPKGFNLVLWVLPFVVLVAGVILGLWFVRRWSTKKSRMDITALNPAATAKDQPDGLRSQLLRERGRLVAETKELEFDFQCDKLSEADYTSLRSELETKAAAIARQLESLPTPTTPPLEEGKAPRPAPKKSADARGRFRRWQLVAGGTFLLIFGVTVGVLLTNSLRPRTSAQDSLTGDFLTGTSSGSSDMTSLLNEGKAAFANQDWPKAIETFKKVLAADPNHPEAHSYMGFILVQAGHGDGALTAFEKALSIAPNLPMALWGKGMVLYREKQDYQGAREVLGRLVQILPAGEDRSEIEKVLAQLPQSNKRPPAASATSRAQQITGKITIDPKVKSQLDGKAALFIIARSTVGAGPPLAVKKIERPTFPLNYSLGSENMMMRGGSFTGKLNISVRLDKDGDPLTREAGNLLGESKKNPVEVGSNNVDIVIDQVAK
ncbi:MAG: cytochrome c-type biogenesis protein CcmH [Candidatus Binatia bacterium]